MAACFNLVSVHYFAVPLGYRGFYTLPPTVCVPAIATVPQAGEGSELSVSGRPEVDS